MTICKNGLQHRNSFERDYGSRAILRCVNSDRVLQPATCDSDLATLCRAILICGSILHRRKMKSLVRPRSSS